MAYEDKSTTQLVQEIRSLLAVAENTPSEVLYIRNTSEAGRLISALDARLSIGSDPLPDQWKENYMPVGKAVSPPIRVIDSNKLFAGNLDKQGFVTSNCTHRCMEGKNCGGCGCPGCGYSNIA